MIASFCRNQKAACELGNTEVAPFHPGIARDRFTGFADGIDEELRQTAGEYLVGRNDREKLIKPRQTRQSATNG